MSSQLLINRRRDERRVALIENGVTAELFFEALERRTLVGNIYKGRVVRVLPGMQSAFVDVGLARAAFLFVGDVVAARQPDENGARPPIEQLIQGGQELLVQVTKEPIGSKGARLSTQITLPGRSVVFAPYDSRAGVSRRIRDPVERQRLRAIAEALLPESGGLIVRTVAEGCEEEELREDLTFLLTLWDHISRRAESVRAPELLHADLDVALRSVRDRAVDRVLVDHPAEAERIRDFMRRFVPGSEEKVETWQGPDELFERFGLEWEISRAMRRKVWLRSGGYITIDRTEALTVVDVNSGRYVGQSDFEETVLEINLEAVREIAYQLRLRDIGGLIVIDFIDLESQAHRDRVHEALVLALKDDKARTYVLPMSPLGLIEMTRKRVRGSIVNALTEPCLYCEGKGYLRSIRVIADSVLSSLEQRVRLGATGILHVMAHPHVTAHLLEDRGDAVGRLEQDHGVEVQLVSRQDLHLEQFRID